MGWTLPVSFPCRAFVQYTISSKSVSHSASRQSACIFPCFFLWVFFLLPRQAAACSESNPWNISSKNTVGQIREATHPNQSLPSPLPSTPSLVPIRHNRYYYVGVGASNIRFPHLFIPIFMFIVQYSHHSYSLTFTSFTPKLLRRNRQDLGLEAGHNYFFFNLFFVSWLFLYLSTILSPKRIKLSRSISIRCGPLVSISTITTNSHYDYHHQRQPPKHGENTANHANTF